MSSSWPQCSVVIQKCYNFILNTIFSGKYVYELLHLLESESSLSQNLVLGRESCLDSSGEVGACRARGAVVCVTDNRVLNSCGKRVGRRWWTLKVNSQFDHVSIEWIVFEDPIAVSDSVRIENTKSFDDICGSVRCEESNMNSPLQSVLSCQVISRNVLFLEEESFYKVLRKTFDWNSVPTINKNKRKFVYRFDLFLRWERLLHQRHLQSCQYQRHLLVSFRLRR